MDLREAADESVEQQTPPSSPSSCSSSLDEFQDDHDLEDDSNIVVQQQRFHAQEDMANYGKVIFAYLQNPRSYKSESFITIWDIARRVDSLPRDSEAEVELVFHGLLDILEEVGDPQGPVQYEPSHRFIRLVLAQASKMLGKGHIIRYKLYLMQIFLSSETAAVISSLLEEENCMDDLKRLFSGATVPRPDTGTFLDGNSDEDKVRDIRYLWSLAQVFMQSGDLHEASAVLNRSLELAAVAQLDEEYHRRRGESGIADLSLCKVRIEKNLEEMRA